MHHIGIDVLERQKIAGRHGEHIRAGHHVVGVDEVAVAGHHGERRVRPEFRDFPLEELWLQQIVIVQNDEELRSRGVDRRIQVPAAADILVVAEIANPRIRKAAHHRRGVIGRSIVEHEEFKVAKRLGEDRRENPGEIGRAIVSDDGGGQGGHGRQRFRTRWFDLARRRWWETPAQPGSRTISATSPASPARTGW